MGNKVDVSEVIERFDEWKTASENIKSSLIQIEESIEAFKSMSSFSGKAAKEAKAYLEEFHETILTSFNNVCMDMDEQLKQHIDSFHSTVDESESAIIESDYLLDTKTDIDDDYNDLSGSFAEVWTAINNIEDITSATVPNLQIVYEAKMEATEIIEELEENLDTFTNEGQEDTSQTDEMLQHLEAALNNAGAVEGQARFTDFKGAGTGEELAALNAFNSDIGKSREINGDNIEHVTLSEIEQSKDQMIQDLNETEQKILNGAFDSLINGDIDRAEYFEVVSLARKAKEENSEVEISDNIFQYLYDNKEKFGIDVSVNGTATAGKVFGYELEGLGKTFKEMSKLMEGTGQALSSYRSGFKIFDTIFKPFNMAGHVIQFTGKVGTVASNFITKTGKAIGWAGKALGGTFLAVSSGIGIIEDLDKGKTVGQAIAHNGTSLITGLGVSSGAGFLATTLSLSNPVGWAALAGFTAGTVATWGFNYVYDNNFFGFQDKLDTVGKKLDDIGKKAWKFGKETFKKAGQGVMTKLNNTLNPMKWGW